MNSFGRRVLSLLLCICMILSVVPVFAFADETVSDVQQDITVVAEEAAEETDVETEEETEEETEVETEEETEEEIEEETEVETEEETNNAAAQEVKALFDTLCAKYYREFDGEQWVLFETLLATMRVEDMIAYLDGFGYAMNALNTLPDEQKATVEAEYANQIVFLTNLAMAINEKAASPETTALVQNWFDVDVTDGYYNIISEKHYGLVPGAEEAEIVLNNASGTRRQVVHVFKVDGSKVDILPGYYGIDKDVTLLENQTDAKVTDTAAYYENTLGYDLVGGMNIALAYDSNAPYSFLVYEGKVLQDYHSDDPLMNQHSGSCSTYLAVYKDGSCELRSKSEPLKGDEWHAVGANFGWLVKDGELATKTPERTSAAASRSMLGILPDGSLIMCMVDGRSANNSVGLSNYEMGEFMLALGCVNAVNGDGGGSSTFISRREGETNLTMRSVPSDGAERPTLHSVFLAKKAGVEPGIFDHANIQTDYDYFVPATTYDFDVVAIDTTGVEMAMPEGGSWSVSDTAFGTINENGVFVSSGKLGEVTIKYTVSETVAEKTIIIANPTVAKFTLDSTVLPYSKSTELLLDVWADKIGEYEMYFQADSFDWSVTAETAGTLNLDKMTYTATSDESVKGVTITAAYKHAEMDKLTFQIDFGKGSEIIAGWDFENGDVSEWMGFDAAKQWSIENGVNNTLVGSDPFAGQYSDSDTAKTFLATKENGQVKNGQYALGVELDYKNSSFAGWSYNHLMNVGEKRVLRDVANGLNATTLGMWVYVPEGAPGLAMQAQLCAGVSADGVISFAGGNFMFTTVSGAKKTLNSCTEADIPASRWMYATFDLTPYDYVCTLEPFSTQGHSRSPSFIRFYIKPMNPSTWTFYFDDITLDYSSAVDDREEPVFGEIQYATEDTAVNADGAAINASSAAFSASVADYQKNNMSGLNTTTAQIYLDGMKVDTQLSGNIMATAGNISLSSGKHTVTFEIADMLGNYAQKSASFTVAATEEKSLVYVAGRNDSGNKPEYDSVYYIDLKTDNAKNVQYVEANIQLNTSNKWELEGMTVAPGYEVEYIIPDQERDYVTFAASDDMNSVENVVCIMLTRTDDCTLTGEQTLLSLPVRVWSWEGVNHTTGKPITPEEQFASGYCPIVTIDYEVLTGFVETSDGDVVTFGGNDSVETMLNDNINPWHVHEVVALEDKAATCDENGYTGRTYCYGCASVIDWGNQVVSAGHSDDYDYYSGILACPECGEVANITGLIEHNGFTYYAIAGNLQKQWQQIGDDWYFFYANSYKGAWGNLTAGSAAVPVIYKMENGKLSSGVWVEVENGVRYYYGPSYYKTSWVTIDGEKYYFDSNGYRLTGYNLIKLSRYSKEDDYQMYLFAEDGKLLETLSHTGLLEANGNIYYLVNGIGNHAGLIQIGEDFYYINSDYMAVTGEKTISADWTNGLKPAGTYTFGPDGKMIQEPEVQLNGFHGDYYYIDGAIQMTGLTKVGEDYYYFSTTNGVMSRNITKMIYRIHESCDLPQGEYTFDADGKVVFPEPELENGIIGDYYYVDGVIQKPGLIKIGEDYYYFSTTNGVMSRNVTKMIYRIHESCDLPQGEYTFDADGKVVFPEPEVQNGIVGDYYYINGVIQKPGLIKIGEDYYYFSTTNGIMTRGMTKMIYRIHESCDLPKGEYTFGADGKVIF